MKSQITCPACKTPYFADVYQIIDVGLQPELKMAFINGQLNIVQCPNCGAATQVKSPLLYHDPDHEQFMVYVPMEMKLSQADQEKMIGQLVQAAMDQLPAEKRRGYMLQPKTILSMQTLVEQVLETEGITPEMISRQREKSDLLRTLLTVDSATADQIISDREDEIDEEFFAMFRSLMDATEQADDSEQILKMVNLQAKLYRDTAFGKNLERQQIALRKFSQDAKNEGGVKPSLLLKHVLLNKQDERVIRTLVASAQQAFNYDFFVQLSDRIEKREKKGIDASELIDLRTQLLDLQRQLERISQEIIRRAQQTLVDILKSDDRPEALRRNLAKIDDTFLYVLRSRLDQARQSGDKEQERDLRQIQDQIIRIMEDQAPPQLRLLNQLMRVSEKEDLEALLADNGDLVNDELLEIVNAMIGEAKEASDRTLLKRLADVRALIETRV